MQREQDSKLDKVLTIEAEEGGERLAGIKTEKLFREIGNYWQGLQRESENELHDLLNNNLEFRLRTDDLEKDKNFKQIIPYFLVRDGKGKYFTATRRSLGGDKRAHGFQLIGFGGHLRKEDIKGPMSQWLIREFDEELVVEELQKIEFLGILNDDRDELGGIGKVHIGLVFVITVNGNVSIREKDNFENGRFESLEDIVNKQQGLETWSRITADYLIKKAV
jgi:predicted NUDIX family phosphoesterase